MLCPFCGRKNREGAKFCKGCSATLSPTCQSCGADLEADAAFCDRCNAPLAVSTAGARTPTPHPSPALPASFAGGRHHVRRFLGEGGKKRVYLAHDARLDREVAIAVIKTEGLDEAGLARVQQEAQAMARLGDHPCIVTIFDISEEDGQPYIVSQYMAGGDLEGMLRGAENHRLPPDQALRIADQIAQALEHAHARGIVHRDLKPGNIWLARDGTAKLGDFGLAVALDRSRLTASGMIVGTATYMPPEQALGRPADARSDLYSLGCVLYEMVTGRPPFLGDNAVAVISQHINTAPVAPSWHNPEVQLSLETLILRLLAKAPEERPESAHVVREALNAILSMASTGAEQVVQKEVNPLDRLAGGVFVGREQEIDELRAGLEDALSGHGSLLMLVGEPGMGKTRTAEQLATYAGLRNMQVLWGRCHEGEGAPAYWPWVQIIRSYLHDRDTQALTSEMGPAAADIAQVVSEVRERIPGLPTPPTLEPEQARFRLFDSVTTFLRNAANHQPILLILDDLHWADKPSLLLLQFLARELGGTRLLALGTYRDVELTRKHPLSQMLGELTLARRIHLGGLNKQDVARFIEMTAGESPPEALVEPVYRKTEGNPFFVNEVVRLLVSERRLERPGEVKSWSVTIPPGVREVVGRRLDRLSEECNQVLTIASVIGREFGLDALEQVSDLPADRLLETVEEAASARVVAEVPRTVGRYGFSHALIRETLYDELSTTRRVRLHRQIGGALEGLYRANPAPHLTELAYHFCESAQGGDVGKAVDYAQRAGHRALGLFAYEDAVGHYERALQALELTDEPKEGQRSELLLALGESQTRAGDSEVGRETFWKAADIARELGQPELLARAALGFGAGLGAGVGLEFGVLDEQQVGLLEETLDAFGDQDSTLRSRVLARVATALYSPESRERRTSLSLEAVEMARRVRDPAALAYALSSRHEALRGPENVEDRLAAATEILRLAEEASDKELALTGHFWRLADLLELGEIPAADLEIEAYDRLAQELRQPIRLWWTPVHRGMRALLEGRFEEGEQLAQQALAMGQGVQRENAVQGFAVQTATVLREQGRFQEIEGPLKGFVAQYPTVPAWRCALVLMYSELGREDEARAEFERLAANDFLDLPQDAVWLLAVILLSEVCASLGDSRRAAQLYKLLLPYAERNIVLGVAACYGSGSRYLGLLAATMCRWEDAVLHFEDALQMNARMGTRPWVAHTQHEYARMLLARGEPGDREKSLELLGQALDMAEELGMKSLVEKALALKLRSLGIDPTDIQTSIDAVASAVSIEQPDLYPHAAPDGTITILFTDIEGSTAMNERLGDHRWLELLRSHNDIVRRHVAAQEGFEVKSQGDGFMLAFQSARRALRCAIDIQRAFVERNSGADEPIHVRMGLHTGEAIREAGDFFGKNVTLAARIANEARGDEILVSSQLKDLTESAGEMEFGDGRELELKGLTGVHRVFQVRWA